MLKQRLVNPGYEYTYQDWLAGVIKTEDLISLVESRKLSQLDYESILHIQKSQPQEEEVKHYQYTYEDWLKGEINPRELEPLWANDEMSEEVYFRIIREQDEAYLKRLSDSLEALKISFIQEYKASLVQYDYLQETIIETKQSLKSIKLNNEHIYREALTGSDEGRILDSNQVKEYLSYEVGKEYDWSWNFQLLRGYHTDVTPFNYILKANYLKWLLWFEAQQKLDVAEPVIQINAYDAENKIREIKLKKQITYAWLNNPKKELPELYQLLIEKELIHPDTTLNQLSAVFTAKPLEAIQPIKWHEDNASELLYFILQLQGEDGSIIEKENKTNYQRLKACFIKPDGKPFTENFRQAKQNLKSYGLATAKQNTIDSIVQHFY